MKTGIAAGSISGETKSVMPFPAAWIMNRISRCSRSLFIAGWIFFFLSASGTADAADRSRSLELLQKAEQVLGRGDTSLALSVLKEVIRADRKFSDARHRLAQLYIDKGDLESRIRAGFEVDEAIRRNPKRIDYLHTRVRLCMAAGTPGAAERA